MPEMMLAAVDYVDAKIQNTLDGYYTKNETDVKLNEKLNSEHTHTKASITDFPTVVSKTESGLCPTLPDETTTTKYLRQDGSWTVPPNDNTTYSSFVKSGSTAAAGLVPKPDTAASTKKFLCEDGAWENVSFTYCVDSNDKLRDWANNVTSGGQDYSVVYVAPGNWSLNKNATQPSGSNSATNPARMIDCTATNTKKVFGTKNSKITLTNNGNNQHSCGIYGINASNFSITDLIVSLNSNNSGYGFHTCNNLTNCTGTGGGAANSSGYGFHTCTNLTNCTGTGSGSSGGYGFHTCNNLTNCTGTSSGDNSGYGFHTCNNLTNCTGTGGAVGCGYGFYNCNNLTNCTGTGSSNSDSAGYGFHTCTNLTNCTGTGTGNNTCDGYGFYTCTKLTNCTGIGNGSYGNSNGYGFHTCTNLSNCTGTGTAYGAGTGKGFYSCRTGFGNRGTYIGTIGTTGASYMQPTGNLEPWDVAVSGGCNNSAAP